MSVDESPLNLESAQVNHPELNTRLDGSVALNLSQLGDVTACISVLLPKKEKHDISNPGRERKREGREGGGERTLKCPEHCEASAVRSNAPSINRPPNPRT